MLKNSIQKTLSVNQQPYSLLQPAIRSFTGKTESGFKFRTPKMRMRVVNPVFPPPGLNLQVPADMTPEKFCKQIGGDCGEYSDKFETIDEVFNLDSVSASLVLMVIERDENQGSATSAEEVHLALQRAA